MSAWDKLLAASSLAIGTAWELISSPRTGSGLIINTGVTAQIPDAPLSIAFTPAQTTATINLNTVSVAVADSPITIGVTTP